MFVSERCQEALKEYNKNLQEGKYWALKMYDATAKLQSGIFSGNLENLGAFDQCIKITSNTSSETINGKYCLGKYTVPVNFSNNEDQYFIKNKQMTWAVCIPDACTGSEVTSFYSNLLSSYLKVSKIDLHINENLCQTANSVYSKITVSATVTLIFLAIILCIIICSTTYDVYAFYRKRKTHDILLIFSIVKNGNMLFRMSKHNGYLTCLDGLRCISMLWIILLHEYSVFPTGPVANVNDYDCWKEALYSMYVSGGNVAVDTFFVMSGFLIIYNFMKQDTVSLNIFTYYFHRYMRLTPALAAMILISATLLQYLGSGPYWQVFIKYFQKPCEEHWWTTLLYVQNYTNVTSMVGHSWYLAVEMQLYLISPLLLYVLKKSYRLFYVATSILIVASTSAAFATAWDFKLPAILTNIFGNRSLYNTQYYLLTHTRASSWLIGVLFGVIFIKFKQKALKISKFVALIFWIISLAVLVLCIFGGHQTLRGQNYNTWGNALHIALVRPAWCLSICWIILACCFGLGGPINTFLSLPPFQILTRIVYSMYIIHVTLLYMWAYSRKLPKQFSDLSMIYNFWGDTCFTTIIAIIWVFAFEAPILAMEKIWYNRNRNR